MKKTRSIFLVTISFYLLSVLLIYFSPRFDWLTLFLFFLLFSFQSLVLFHIQRKMEREQEKQIKSLIQLIQEIEQKDEKIAIQNTPLGRLRDEILKTLVEKRESKEQAVQARRLLKQNVEDITHQIKTPITGILLLLDLMQEDPQNKSEYLSRVQSTLERLYRLADLLLKLSALDAEMVKMKKQKISAMSLIHDSEPALSAFLEEKEINFQIKSSDIEFFGDRTWLLEAVSNVLKNAIDASPPGSHIEISFTQNPIFSSIFIQDYGPGISTKEQRKLFDRFYKVNAESSGFGIGLPLVKSIVEAHGGSIHLRSDVNSTCFELRFYNNSLA